MDKQLWIKDPRILISDFKNCIPKKESGRIEQMNQASLCILYIYIIGRILRFKSKTFNYILLALLIIIIIIYISRYDSKSNEIEFMNDMYNNDDNNTDTIIDMNNIKKKYKNRRLDDYIKRTSEYNKNIVDTINNKYKNKLEYQEDLERNPTLVNPYMNPLLIDYNTENMAVPFNTDDELIKENIKLTFNKDLFKDFNQLFDEKNAERQFYTVPGNSIPNDQQKFAEWCYKVPSTCKEDTRSCRIDEDIRYRTSYL